MAAKSLKVKDLAGKYGVSPKDIVKELADKDNTCPEWLKDVVK